MPEDGGSKLSKESLSKVSAIKAGPYDVELNLIKLCCSLSFRYRESCADCIAIQYASLLLVVGCC
jgi:hypothetical protein